MLGKSHGETIAAEAGHWALSVPEMPFDTMATHAMDFWLTVNPSLTIMANALRVGDHLLKRLS